MDKCLRSIGLAGLMGLALTLTVGTRGAFADHGGGGGGAGRLGFEEHEYEVGEGDGVAHISVERSDGSSGAASVQVQSVGGTAIPGVDYVAVNVTLNWADGEDGPKTFDVTILDDGVADPDETVELQLSNATGATIDGDRANATLTIHDNHGGGGGGGCHDGEHCNGVLKFDERNYFAPETGGIAVITVEREEGSTGAVTVDFATSDGTGVAGEDYTTTTGTLSWADGDNSVQSFSVPLLTDTPEGINETVNLALSNATGGATIDSEHGTAVLTIIDTGGGGGGGGGGCGGPAGMFRFDEEEYEVIESQVTQAVITVRRIGGSQGAVTVDFATSDGSATSGVDYTPASGTLSWADGDSSSKTFVVPVLGDPAVDGTETVNLALSNPTGGATIQPEHQTAVLQLLDNEESMSSCLAGPNTGCAQGNRFAFDVTYRTAQGASGRGNVVALSGNSAMIWFFSADNAEMLVKVLDACSFHAAPAYWVFFSATTNVDFTLRVTDTRTGLTREYQNMLGQAAVPVQDLSTFRTCP